MKENDIIICGHGGGRPSLKQLGDYNSLRYSQIANNGVRKGVVCVMRLKTMTRPNEIKFKHTYKKILGRNYYSQLKREYVYTPKIEKENGKDVARYYSDCSSSGMATLQQLGYDIPLLNTAGIYNSKLFKKVPVIISKGHIKNPSMLRVGDCILYAGSDPARPKQIGHVEYVYSRGKEKI